MFMVCIGIHACYYSGHREHFRWNLGHFTDSSRNGVLGGTLGSSLGRSFLEPRITYFAGLGQGSSERETVSIESGEISGGGSRVSGPETVIPELSGFHLNSPLPTFLYKCHLLCKLSRIYVYDAHWNSWMLLIPDIWSTFGCYRTGIRLS